MTSVQILLTEPHKIKVLEQRQNNEATVGLMACANIKSAEEQLEEDN